MSSLLERINHPQDLRKLSVEELRSLAGEMRQRILEVVDANGGHLGSNLGTVELTLALHRVFDVPHDRLVWDTSHQSYPHKLVTGRQDRFHEIRTYGGLCGFTNHKESIFDLFDAGHAGTACSLALGVASADGILGRDGKSIAVVGDSAAASGMTFEALNHGGENRRNLLVILNDNNMSINKAVGALSKYLTRARTKPAYADFKREAHAVLSRIPLLGKHVEDVLHELHEKVRKNIVPGSIFQELGYQYFGPVDGHDLPGLISLFEDLKQNREPVLLHLATQKGHGYDAAEADPIKYHASKDFLERKQGSDEPSGAAERATTDPKACDPSEPRVASSRAASSNGRGAASKPTSAEKPPAKRPGYSRVFTETLLEQARRDRRLCAITAGMPDGTGLVPFSQEFPDRYFDVGIAEQHGGGLASGLAYGGLRPVYAVYSTFLQRAYDQVVHDICIQENSVILCLDRAGLTGEDGWTHHGVFDIAYLRCIPNIILAAPRDASELVHLFQLAVDQSTQAFAIRYPKAAVPDLPASADAAFGVGKAEVLIEGEGTLLFAYGSMVEIAHDAIQWLDNKGVFQRGVRRPTLVNARFAKPIDVELLARLSKTHDHLVTLEEHVLQGGFGSAVLEAVADEGIRFERTLRFGVPDRFITFGSRSQLLAECGLDARSIAERLEAVWGSAPSGESSGTGDTAASDSTADRWNHSAS